MIWERIKLFVIPLMSALVIGIGATMLPNFYQTKPVGGDFVHLSDGTIGALLGGFFGATSTYFISERSRNKQREIDEIKEQRLKIRAYERAMLNVNAEIEATLVLILKNTDHYKDMRQGIVDKNGKFRASISLPHPYAHKSGLGIDIMNIAFASQWQSFESEIILQNANLVEFNNYYSALSASAHDMLLKGETLNPQVIHQDNKAIMQGSVSCIVATENFKERCLGLIARIDLIARRWKVIDFTSIELEDLLQYIETLRHFEPQISEINDYVNTKLRDTYISEKAFSSIKNSG